MGLQRVDGPDGCGVLAVQERQGDGQPIHHEAVVEQTLEQGRAHRRGSKPFRLRRGRSSSQVAAARDCVRTLAGQPVSHILVAVVHATQTAFVLVPLGGCFKSAAFDRRVLESVQGWRHFRRPDAAMGWSIRAAARGQCLRVGRERRNARCWRRGVGAWLFALRRLAGLTSRGARGPPLGG